MKRSYDPVPTATPSQRYMDWGRDRALYFAQKKMRAAGGVELTTRDTDLPAPDGRNIYGCCLLYTSPSPRDS